MWLLKYVAYFAKPASAIKSFFNHKDRGSHVLHR